MAASIIEEIVREAKDAGASDVHLTAGIPPKMRINGKLVTMSYAKMMPGDTLDILLSLLSETQRDRFEEEGEYNLSFTVSNCGRCRVNAYRQKGSVALALRLVEMEVPSLESLGAPEAVMELCGLEQGLVLAAGPSGSGKSTTLAAMIDRINTSKDVHILTLEEPIEYLHQHKRAMVNQREIGLDCINYTNGLEAALREDVDVLMIGKMKGTDSVNAAIMAAEAGCLVLSAVNTVKGDDAINRLISMFPSGQREQVRVRLGSVLEAVVFQQLIPSADGGKRGAAFDVLHTKG